MSQLLINIGTGPNTKDGDTVRVAFNKVNQNFTDLYTSHSSSVTISNSTPPSSPDNGNLWWDSSDGNLYIRFDNAWVPATTSNAQTGYTGSQGPAGGYTGSAGYTGSVGSGYTGSRGNLGYTGSVGSNGYTGSIGFSGSAGGQGTIGFAGSAGFTGSQGIGFTGSQGINGYNGSVGYTGSGSNGSYANIANTTVERNVDCEILVSRIVSTDIHLGDPPTLDDRNVLLQATNSLNSYMQMWQQNTSSGQYASTDYVVTNDIGTDNSHYLDIGINSSGYNDPSFNIVGVNDGYLYTSDGNLAIGTANTGKDLVFFTDGTENTNEAGRISSKRWLLGATDDTTSKLQVDGDVAITNGVLKSKNIDASGNAVTVANGATVNFANFSGTITITGQGSIGYTDFWICGGAAANMIGSGPTPLGSCAYNAGILGYTWTNSSGTTGPFVFATVKTRTIG